MSRLYGENHRALQDAFDTRRLADRIEALAMKTELDEQATAFIGSRDMFFLSSIDGQGRPTVSYKGGEPGFVRVLDARTIAFPSYDGNGMYLSMGNITANPKVGLLFIDFETPFRMRVQGEATIAAPTDPLMADMQEAEMVVRVAVSEVWINCPRYVHTYTKVAGSRYAPKAACETPLAEWKRVDIIQDALPARDVGRAEQSGGLITIEDWFSKVGEGKG